MGTNNSRYNQYDKKKQMQASTSNEPYRALKEEDYVQRAEKVIEDLGKTQLTTTQLRNILSMINQLYNEVIMTTDEVLSEEMQSQFRYLKVKLVYAAGRNKDVKAFVTKSQIAEHLDHIDSSRKAFILYMHYMEALVAYHRFNQIRN